MKQKYHFYSSIISMILTSVLLVFVVLAWYVTNKEATASGINGMIADLSELVDSVDYYLIDGKQVSGTSTTFTIGQKVQPTQNKPTIDMGPYDAMDAISTPQCLMAIRLNSDASVSKIHIDATADREETTDAPRLTLTGNALSFVIAMYIPTTVSEANKTLTVDTTKMLSFAVENTNSDRIDYDFLNNISLGDITPMNNTVYILFDYNTDAIEYIYSENIGNSVLDSDEQNIEYNCDFRFWVKGV